VTALVTLLCVDCDEVRTVRCESGDTVPWLIHRATDHEVEAVKKVPDAIQSAEFEDAFAAVFADLSRGVTADERRTFYYTSPSARGADALLTRVRAAVESPRKHKKKPQHGRHWSAPDLRQFTVERKP
jgi:hypothetical protein